MADVQAGIAPVALVGMLVAAVIAFRKADGANQDGKEVGGDGQPYSDWTFYRCVNTADKLVNPDCWQPIPARASLAPTWRISGPCWRA